MAEAQEKDATQPQGGQAPGTSTNQTIRLPEVLVEGREDSLIGIANSATQGTVGAVQLSQRPISRPGEVLETVPGVIITQHSGAGKANQYFLRGFNLDHGTDFATSVDGVPVNLPSHGHGQGYTDLNFLIPELIRTVNYKKGVYYADEGDFASAGAANLEYFTVLPMSLALVEGGSFGYARGVFASSPKVGKGNLLYGLELFHNDGPWKHPDDYKRVNGTIRYSQGDAAFGYSITAMGYYGDWDATDQVARRAVEQPGFGRFDSLDPTSGGDSQRYSLSGEWHRSDEKTATKVIAYGFYYDLDLFSNFTYFLNDPVNGDQFEQKDKRWVSGMKASHQWFSNWHGREMETTVGLQLRNDFIENGLFNTVQRNRLSTVREDDIVETSVGPYMENKMQWTQKFRTVAGLRADFFHFDSDGNDPANSGTESDFIASPKLGLIFGP